MDRSALTIVFTDPVVVAPRKLVRRREKVYVPGDNRLRTMKYGMVTWLTELDAFR
jgi:hypothetical protein